MTQKILIIQTAFLGDVILATAIIESLGKLKESFEIDFLLRKGNENVLKNNPYVTTIYVWDKENNRIRNLINLHKIIKKNRYNYVINLQRFLSTGFITAFSKAKIKIGFRNNPLSFFYSYRQNHVINPFIEMHEIERNHQLLLGKFELSLEKPKLYPHESDYVAIKNYTCEPYICCAPASVWLTKQFPKERWISFFNLVPEDFSIILLGSASDKEICEELQKNSHHSKITDLSGKLSILQTGALMQTAVMNYVNDSAPLHIASAMNAPVCAIFCSTIPEFGFYPLSDNSRIISVDEKLECRPCGIHGKVQCPENHFKCGLNIELSKLLEPLQ